MEQTKKSTYKLLFYLKKDEPKKNGNVLIMARIIIDGTPKTMGTKLEIDPNIWDLKFGRVEGKSAKALSIKKKLDNIRGGIDNIYEDMLKHEGFATAQKVKIKFHGVMDDAVIKVFNDQNEEFKKMVAKGKCSQSTYSKYNTVYNRVLPLFSSQLKIEFIVERGEDKMKQEIESNYRQIKSDILRIVENEMERINNDPNIQHLIQQE